MGWFGRSKSAAAVDDDIVDVEPLDGAPSAKPERPFAVKGLRKSKNKERKLAVLFRSSSRESYWSLNPDDGVLLSQLDQDQVVTGQIISFTNDDDKELLTEERDSESAMKKKIMADVGDEVVVVSTVKKNGWMYATPLARVRDVQRGTRIYSGKLILRSLLEQSGRTPESGGYVLGAAFRGVMGTTALVMFKVDDTGAMTGMQYVPVPGNSIEGALRNYIQTVRLSATGEISQDRIIIFSEEDVHHMLGQVKAYPEELEIAGVSLLVWGRLGLAGSSLALLGVLGQSAILAYQAKSTASQAASIRAQTVQSRDAAKQLYLDRLPTILAKTNLSVARPIDVANRIHMPGGLVEFESDRRATVLKVRMPIADSQDASDVAKSLNFEPAPDGCSRRPIESNRSLSDLQVVYECPQTDNVAEYLLGSGS